MAKAVYSTLILFFSLVFGLLDGCGSSVRSSHDSLAL